MSPYAHHPFAVYLAGSVALSRQVGGLAAALLQWPGRVADRWAHPAAAPSDLPEPPPVDFARLAPVGLWREPSGLADRRQRHARLRALDRPGRHRAIGGAA